MSTLLAVPEVKGGVTITADATQLKAQLLEISRPVTAVTSIESRDSAITISRNLKTHIADVEKSRKDVKEPILKMGRAIDEAAATHVKEIQTELERVNRLISGFEEERRRKEQEELRAKQAEIDRIQREADEAERKRVEAARKLEELPVSGKQTMKAMSEEFDAEEARIEAENKKRELEKQQQQLAEQTQAVRSTGGSLRTELEIEVTDKMALVKAHPELCRIEADLPSLKFYISTMEGRNDGKPVTIPGIRYSRKSAFSSRKL